MVVFVLVLLSDVLGVEVFLLAPTASGGDDAGPRFCAPLPPSPPRFRGIVLKTLNEFPSTVSFFTLFFLWNANSKALGSHGGSGGNFEDYIRFLSCHLFGPVNHGQTWKGWERSGEKD